MIYPDFFRKMRRGPQIITIKDMALISAFTGIHSGCRVVDAGAGSGFLAAYLGNLVRPNGWVVSYEKRNDHFLIASRNMERAGLSEVVTIKEKDISEGIDENELDLITLDMPDTSMMVAIAFDALKPGGWLVSYVPGIEQMRMFALKCERAGFRRIENFESMLRSMLVKERGTRPQTKGLLHTGYLSFAQKPKT